MQLSLEPMDGLRQHGDTSFEVVYTYTVRGLPSGHGAWIQNLDYPRNLWSVQRFRRDVPEGQPSGNYLTAEDALSMLQKEYK